MASIEKRVRNGRSRWYIRYRDPSGNQRTKTFDRRIDGERYLTTVESAKLAGSYTDPRRAAVTIGEFANKWQAAQAHLKPSTRERYAGLLRTHVAPRWSSVRLSDVGHADVQAWVSSLPKRGRHRWRSRHTVSLRSSCHWRFATAESSGIQPTASGYRGKSRRIGGS